MFSSGYGLGDKKFSLSSAEVHICAQIFEPLRSEEKDQLASESPNVHYPIWSCLKSLSTCEEENDIRNKMKEAEYF